MGIRTMQGLLFKSLITLEHTSAQIVRLPVYAAFLRADLHMHWHPQVETDLRRQGYSDPSSLLMHGLERYLEN
jgi:hypothetical protein